MRRSFVVMAGIELKLFVRQPQAAFFTLVFPLLILFVLGAIFGNRHYPGSSYGAVDLAVPGYLAMILGTTGLMGIPAWISTYREQGVFRRLRVTPVSPAVLLAAQAVVGFIASLMGALLVVAAGRFAFGLKLPDAPLAVLPAFALASLSMFALGGMIAAVAPTARTAQAVGMVVYFPMLFLSGATFPRMLMPPGVRQVSDFLPMTHVGELLGGLWLAGEWRPASAMMLGGLLLVTSVVAVRSFRWE